MERKGILTRKMTRSLDESTHEHKHKTHGHLRYFDDHRCLSQSEESKCMCTHSKMVWRSSAIAKNLKFSYVLSSGNLVIFLVSFPFLWIYWEHHLHGGSGSSSAGNSNLWLFADLSGIEGSLVVDIWRNGRMEQFSPILAWASSITEGSWSEGQYIPIPPDKQTSNVMWI